MQSQREQRTGLVIWIGVVAMAALVGLAGGLGLASTVLESGDSDLEARHRGTVQELFQAQTEVQRLQAALDESQTSSEQLTVQLDQETQSKKALEAQLLSAQEEIAQKTSALAALSTAQEQISELQKQLEGLRSQITRESNRLGTLKEMASSIENHRLLMVELRRDPPVARDEAFTYWRSLKTLAARASPSLASPADRVILGIDSYFDWQDRSPSAFASAEAYLDWLSEYDLSGAVAYDNAIADFTKDALLSVISQLDAVKAKLE